MCLLQILVTKLICRNLALYYTALPAIDEDGLTPAVVVLRPQPIVRLRGKGENTFSCQQTTKTLSSIAYSLRYGILILMLTNIGFGQLQNSKLQYLVYQT